MVEKAAPELRHVTLLQGTKAYGVHVRPIAIPAREDRDEMREDGLPLTYTGGAPNLMEAVDADLLASAIEWAGEALAARDQAFNITNGDVFLWRSVWPAIADALDMQSGGDAPLSRAPKCRHARKTGSAFGRSIGSFLRPRRFRRALFPVCRFMSRLR